MRRFDGLSSSRGRAGAGFRIEPGYDRQDVPVFGAAPRCAVQGALEAKGRNYVAVGHAPNLGADPIHFLWQLRHNTENSLQIPC
jgi:hypothetical protein